MSVKVEALLGLPEELQIVGGDVAEKEITLTAISTQINPRCPLCGTNASRVHSRYSRRIDESQLNSTIGDN